MVNDPVNPQTPLSSNIPQFAVPSRTSTFGRAYNPDNESLPNRNSQMPALSCTYDLDDESISNRTPATSQTSTFGYVHGLHNGSMFNNTLSTSQISTVSRTDSLNNESMSNGSLSTAQTPSRRTTGFGNIEGAYRGAEKYRMFSHHLGTHLTPQFIALHHDRPLRPLISNTTSSLRRFNRLADDALRRVSTCNSLFIIQRVQERTAV